MTEWWQDACMELYLIEINAFYWLAWLLLIHCGFILIMKGKDSLCLI